MVLSGAMFPFDKLNRTIGSVDKVPLIAELMPTRWTYEALMVTQFKDNQYAKVFYEFEKKSIVRFNLDRISKIEIALRQLKEEYKNQQLSSKNPGRLTFILNELNEIAAISETGRFKAMEALTPEKYNDETAESLRVYLTDTRTWFERKASSNATKYDNFTIHNKEVGRQVEDQYHNIKLKEIVTKFTNLTNYSNTVTALSRITTQFISTQNQAVSRHSAPISSHLPNILWVRKETLSISTPPWSSSVLLFCTCFFISE
ncbi:MAG: hypothetical protein MZV63_34125 [Marinilabiliales bacterium]|nr:hypothetical protein [Marinilabiliales bacterium]